MASAETDTRTQKWQQRFVESLEFDSSPTHQLVADAITFGHLPNNKYNRRKIAICAGVLFSHAFIEETGTERQAEELDINEIGKKSGIEEPILKVVLASMAVNNVLKTKKPQSKWRDAFK